MGKFFLSLTPMTLNQLVNGFGKSIIYLIKGRSGKIPISNIHYWANKIERRVVLKILGFSYVS